MHLIICKYTQNNQHYNPIITFFNLQKQKVSKVSAKCQQRSAKVSKKAQSVICVPIEYESAGWEYDCCFYC